MNPRDLQFLADVEPDDVLTFKGKTLEQVAYQRVKRIGRGKENDIAHFIFYSPSHNMICYDYWPGARFMMFIAPKHKQARYLKVFRDENVGRMDRLWLWLHKYTLVD